MASVADLLRREIDSLVDRVRPWPPTRWGARAEGAGGTRADVARRLAVDLAELAREAGGGAPEGMAPPPLPAHALADQAAVLGAELLAAPRLEAVAVAALAAVASARTALDGSAPPRDVVAALTVLGPAAVRP